MIINKKISDSFGIFWLKCNYYLKNEALFILISLKPTICDSVHHSVLN